MAVFRENGNSLEVLLVRRRHDPYKGMWSLPGGFMEMNETLEQTAVRELKEETGLKGVVLKQYRAFSALNRDPRTRVITVLFYGFIEMERSAVEGSDDAEQADWFPVNSLPPLGFDHREMMDLLLPEIGILKRP